MAFWTRLVALATFVITALMGVFVLAAMHLATPFYGDVLLVKAPGVDACHRYQLLLLDVAHDVRVDVSPQECGTFLSAGWTPDGEWILYSLALDGATRAIIAMMRFDGGDHRAITGFDSNYRSSVYFPSFSWSRDGGRVVFRTFNVADRTTDTMIYDRHNDSLTTLVQGDSLIGNYSSPPQWNPAGDRILYVAGNVSGGNLFLLDPDTGDLTPLGISAHEAVWMPDGDSLVRMEDFRSRGELYRWWIDGRAESQNISDNNFVDFHPRPSPDGQTIAYVSNRGGAWQVYRYDVATEETRLLTETALLPDVGVVWSPDSRAVAFVDDRFLYVVDATTGETESFSMGASAYPFNDTSFLAYRP